MRKQLIVALALVMVAAFAVGAYAEVQNVKVSGDITVKGVARNNFELDNGNTVNTKERQEGSFWMTQTRLRIDADLTDNVSTTVRLINERQWAAEDAQNTDIDLDLAYVTLKEFLYSPLTLTIGRQEIKLGNKFIVGNANTFALGAGTTNGVPRDLSLRKAFDGIRATLNYDPLIIDAFYAKIDEVYNANSAAPNYRNEDNDLYGVNARYELSKKVAVEGYWVLLLQRSRTTTIDANNNVNTVGGLITVTPIENLKGSFEAAYQFGTNRGAGVLADRADAWAFQAMADYTFAKVKYTPKIGGSFTYLEGQNNANEGGWNPMFADQNLNNIPYAIFPFTNLMVFNARGSIKPTEDVTLEANYGYYNRAEKNNALAGTYPISGYTSNGKKDLGQALDLTATYAYTEDVLFSLTNGYFIPGDALKDNGGKRIANQVIGSMKVTF